MTSTTPPRARGRPPLPRDRIIDAAIELVDEQGGDALSLRNLATRLSSGTATLYRHVASRAELVGLVIDRMLAEVPPVEPEVDDANGWEAVCADVARGVFTVLTKHWRAAALLVESFPTGPHAFALRERVTRGLLRAGFDEHTAAITVATLARFVVGFAMQAGATQPTPPELIKAVKAGQYPNLATVAPLLPVQIEEEFDFGLTMILRGIGGGLLMEDGQHA